MKKISIQQNMPIQNNVITTGSFVSYEQNNKIYLAKVINLKNGKLVIENHVNKELEIQSERLYILPKPMNLELTLKELFDLCNEKIKSINLEEIWDLVHDDYSQISISELTPLYFGKDILEDHFSLRLALINDKIYFKRLKDSFEPRKNTSIEELKKAVLAVEKKKVNLSKTSDFFKRQIIEHKKDDIPSEIRENIKLLSEYASDKEGFSNNEIKDIKELITTINSACNFETQNTSPKQAFFLLKSANIFTKHENLFFLRHGFPNTFPNTIKDEITNIKNLLSEKISSNDREDLTNLYIMSVDDISTLDIDDAISIERNEDGTFSIGIHITDLSEFIPINSIIMREATIRGTSLYLPEKTYNMLPDEVANNLLGLIENKERLALSLIIQADRNFNILNSSFKRSKIKVTKRLTYDDLDDLLETSDDENLLFLHNFAVEHELKRVNAGAFSITKKDVNISLDENFNVSLLENDKSTPAQNLVGELMILFNNLFANFAKDNNIPLFFRGQGKANEISEEICNMPEGPVKNYLIRSNMAPSETTMTPIAHSGLGLNAYAQATSPLRRLFDLINQTQVSSFLKDKTISFNKEELTKILASLEESLKTAGQITKETKRYWLIEYLRLRKQKNDLISGIVLRTDLKFPLVELEEVYMNYIIKPKNPVAIGDKVTLKINNANPREDILSLS